METPLGDQRRTYRYKGLILLNLDRDFRMLRYRTGWLCNPQRCLRDAAPLARSNCLARLVSTLRGYCPRCAAWHRSGCTVVCCALAGSSRRSTNTPGNYVPACRYTSKTPRITNTIYSAPGVCRRSLSRRCGSHPATSRSESNGAPWPGRRLRPPGSQRRAGVRNRVA